MSKNLFIAEKPSVARAFAQALGESMSQKNGYLESDASVVTWCVGHLVTMSYPDAYDAKYKKWRLEDLPFLPEKFKYEVIPGVKKQFDIVSSLLNRADVAVIYVCTDSGREGEYIYRLVEQMAGVKDKERRRVWIDSQTDEEIRRGISEAKDLSAYDNLSAAAYLRAKEDYLMGINFSRLLTLKYGNTLASFLHERYSVISVGRVMTCVQGMVVRREREIRAFVKTPFYRIFAKLKTADGSVFEAEWKAVEGSRFYNHPALYKENGFRKKEDARDFLAELKQIEPQQMKTAAVSRKTEKKNPPLLYNLAELQNDCSKMFKISPDETLKIAQELYEKKLLTYPRTDARVLSTAAAKEIDRNLKGLLSIRVVEPFAREILDGGKYKNLAKTRYVDDSKITDHYAIIPTGQGIGALRSLKPLSLKVYEIVVRRFLAVFYPPAVYKKISADLELGCEHFFANGRILEDPGYLKVMEYTFQKKQAATGTGELPADPQEAQKVEKTRAEEEAKEALAGLRKGAVLPVRSYQIREGETTPPKRYNSGSMILAMENAGQLIEDESLREQIKGSGIGTSATRAEILKKLFTNDYLALNKKTQIITPTLRGELIYDVVDCSIRPLLNPELTASWEKGLTYVAEGTITSDAYMQKLKGFISRRTDAVLAQQGRAALGAQFAEHAKFYQKSGKSSRKKSQKVAQ